jgi:hypothetical protein
MNITIIYSSPKSVINLGFYMNMNKLISKDNENYELDLEES